MKKSKEAGQDSNPLTVASFLSQSRLRTVAGHFAAATSAGSRIEVLVGRHVTRLKLVRRGVTGGRVDGGAPPPQRVEPGHEGRVVLEAVTAPRKKSKRSKLVRVFR